MSKNHELDDLKRRGQAAFQHKQSTWSAFAEARDRASAAHAAMESAWQARIAAREEMNREFEAMQQSSACYREVWDEYGRIRDAHSAEIERLRSEADYEHQQMVECFERASDCYESGSKAEAPYWSQQGREHQERRNDLNEAISQLCQAIKAARNAAESRAPKTDASAFHGARTIFQQAKSDHEAAQAEFKRLKAERDRLKAEFDSAQAEHIRLKDEFQRKLEAVKAERRRARDQTLDRANIRSSERADAKIITKPDGTTQIYHGGLGKGDGIGHGHTVLDQSGHKTYNRDAFAAHGHQNFTDDPAKSYPGKGQWGELRHGWIDNHAVTWCEGLGVNAGQTLICDGHVNREYFDAHHDHYGPDTKYKTGDRIEDITDAMKRPKYYSGPSK